MVISEVALAERGERGSQRSSSGSPTTGRAPWRSPSVASEDRNHRERRHDAAEAASWRSPSVASEDRNRVAARNLRAAEKWRSPSVASEDRNNAAANMSHAVFRWRSPSVASEDRNHLTMFPMVAVSSQVALAEHGERGSQRLELAYDGRAVSLWRSPSVASEDRKPVAELLPGRLPARVALAELASEDRNWKNACSDALTATVALAELASEDRNADECTRVYTPHGRVALAERGERGSQRKGDGLQTAVAAWPLERSSE